MKRILFALLLLTLPWTAPSSDAANCGGGTTCACGDTVTSNYTLGSNLSCTTTHGLKVASNVTLTCTTGALSGPGTATVGDTYGIYLDHVTNARVLNCTVSGFRRGVRLNGGSGHLIQGVTSKHNGQTAGNPNNSQGGNANGYGIDLADGSSGNTLSSFLVYGNIDEGIHVGEDANDNVIQFGTICKNGIEALYLLENSGNLVQKNWLGGNCTADSSFSGGNSMYQRDGFENVFALNTFRAPQAHITGASVDTLFDRNLFDGTSLKEDCYTPPTPDTCPSGTVEISASGSPYVIPVINFPDVSVTHPFHAFIRNIQMVNITSGCAGGNYCPDSPVARDQMALFLLRGAHGPGYNPPAGSGTVFGDVPLSQPFVSWIEQLVAEGYTAGCGSGNYCPGTTVARDQMAIFLLKLKHGTGYTPPGATGTMFTDVPISYWAAAWIEQLAREGITAGCGGTNYCPGSPVTRGQMAVFLTRALSL